jgi:hypothetical protein
MHRGTWIHKFRYNGSTNISYIIELALKMITYDTTFQAYFRQHEKIQNVKSDYDSENVV